MLRSPALSAFAVVIGTFGCGSSGGTDVAPTADSAAAAARTSASSGSTEPPSTASVPATPAAPASTPSEAAPPAPAASLPPARPGAAKPAASASATPVASASEAPRGPVAGKPWQLVASADADAGYHCNADYPNKLTTTGGTNVTFPDPKPRGACSGNRVVVNVPIVPTAAGPGTVVGTLSYGICDDAKTSCLIRKKDVTLSFVAAP